MFIVYIIKSIDNNWFYVGMTRNLQKRLREHNRGKTKSTKLKKPFEVVHFKNFKERPSARNYEKYLKIRSNKEKLLRKLKLI